MSFIEMIHFDYKCFIAIRRGHLDPTCSRSSVVGTTWRSISFNFEPENTQSTVLSPSFLYFLSYWRFIAQMFHIWSLTPWLIWGNLFLIKTINYKIILVPNQSIYIFLYIKMKRCLLVQPLHNKKEFTHFAHTFYIYIVNCQVKYEIYMW